jgi:hypothetical protein
MGSRRRESRADGEAAKTVRDRNIPVSLWYQGVDNRSADPYASV